MSAPNNYPPLLRNIDKGRGLLRTKKYESIDGLRAISAFGIASMHVLANIRSGDMTLEAANRIVQSFTNFVYLFFIISAFGMCCGYYERFKTGSVSMDAFYRKRYQRILPFFAVLTFLGLLMSPGWGSLCESFANLTLCFNLLPNPDIEIIGVGWFLGLIFVFYMLFPFFVFLMDNRRRAWIVMGLAIIFHFVAQLYFFTDKFIDFNPQRHNIIFAAPYFVAGGLAYLYRGELEAITKRYRYLVLLVCWLLTVGFFFRPRWADMHLYMIVMFSLWLAYAIGVKDKFLSNKVMKYLSGISMEIYLCHMFVFRIIEKLHFENIIHDVNLLYVLSAVCTILGAIVFSHILKYMVLEKVQ